MKPELQFEPKHMNRGCVLTFILLLCAITIIMFMLSCTKETEFNDSNLVGNWRGVVTPSIATIVSKWNASRAIEHKSNYTLMIWCDAPPVHTAIYVSGDKYDFINIIMPSETWCQGNHIERQLIFNGIGYLDGDTLYERGTITDILTLNGELQPAIYGTWSAKFVHQGHYSE